MSEAKNQGLTEHYKEAKLLFDKTSAMMNLQYKDIAILTTGAADLGLYKELTQHQVNRHKS